MRVQSTLVILSLRVYELTVCKTFSLGKRPVSILCTPWVIQFLTASHIFFFYQTLHHVGGSDRFREERVLEDSPGIYDKNEERRRIRLQYCQGNFLSFVIPFAIQSMLLGLLRPCKRKKLYFAFFCVCVCFPVGIPNQPKGFITWWTLRRVWSQHEWVDRWRAIQCHETDLFRYK